MEGVDADPPCRGVRELVETMRVQETQFTHAWSRLAEGLSSGLKGIQRTL